MQSVGSSGLRLRSQPDMTGNLLAVEPAGTALTVIEAAAQSQAKIGVQGKWLNVRDGRGITGYVAAWFVQAGAAVPAAAQTVTVAAAVGPAGLRLREAPIASSNTLKILATGTMLTLLEPAAGKIGVNGQWLKVSEPGGLTGYVAAWYVQ
jgi:hypothetical protein